MRIAIPTRFAHRAGGVETYLESVLPALQARGHEVGLWHEFPCDPAAGSIAPGSVRLAPLGSAADTSVDALADLVAWQPDVIFSQGINAVALESRMPDVAPLAVMLHAYHGTCISGTKTHSFPHVQPCSRALGPGCLLQFHARRCGGLSPVSMLRDYREQRVRQRLLRTCARVLTISEHMRRECIAQGVDPTQVHTIPAFAPPVAGPIERQGATGDRLHLLFAGRLEQLKGPHLLLEAIGLLEQQDRARLRLTMVGDGREYGRCAGLAQELRTRGAEVVLTGWKSQADCLELIRTADLLVVPSIWPEPFGLVGLEAAAVGVPALAFALGGIPEWLLHGRTGFVVEAPPSAAALAQAIGACVADPGTLRRWGTEARSTAARRTLDGHVDILEQALAGAAMLASTWGSAMRAR